jgi:hypothetical protein
MVRLDTIEMHPFAARLGQRHLCTGGRHRFGGVMDCLHAMASKGPTDYFGVTREFITSCSQRGLVMVISDFLGGEGCEKALQYLADFGHELLVLQVWAEEDRTPPWLGELELVDAESGERLKLQFDEAARDRYTSAFDGHARAIQQMAVRSGGRYVGISTAQPVEEVVFGPLTRVRGIA